MNRSFFALALPILSVSVAACSAADERVQTPSTTVENATGPGGDIYSDDTGLYVTFGLDEIFDHQKSEVVDDAFTIVKQRVGMDSMPSFESKDVVKSFTDGKDYLTRHLDVLAKQGVSWSEVIPSGFFFVVGGAGAAGAGVGGGGGGGVFIVVLPKIIEHTYIGPAGEVRSEWYTRFKVGVSGYGNANVLIGAGAGGSLRAGFGLIWGHMADPSEFRGLALGASLGVSLGAGVDLKALLLKSDLEIKVNNLLGLVEYETGPTAMAGFHFEGTAIVPGSVFFNSYAGGDEKGPVREGSAPRSSSSGGGARSSNPVTTPAAPAVGTPAAPAVTPPPAAPPATPPAAPAM